MAFEVGKTYRTRGGDPAVTLHLPPHTTGYFGNAATPALALTAAALRARSESSK